MKKIKLTKLQVFYLTLLYFALFALIGSVLNIFIIAISWSISIFIILWIAYWSIIYIRDMYYFTKAMIEIMEEEFKIEDKNE